MQALIQRSQQNLMNQLLKQSNESRGQKMVERLRRLPTFYETKFAYTTDKLGLMERTLRFMQLLCIGHHEGNLTAFNPMLTPC